ncbi:hypothetical protein GCM10027614_15640 [Micromonospora vulcania]
MSVEEHLIEQGKVGVAFKLAQPWQAVDQPREEMLLPMAGFAAVDRHNRAGGDRGPPKSDSCGCGGSPRGRATGRAKVVVQQLGRGAGVVQGRVRLVRRQPGEATAVTETAAG